MITLYCGDALGVLRTMADSSVDAIVTDPPAGISFMGKTWDHDHGGREGWVRAFAAIFAECLRVLRPGGRALVWSIPRTSHWTACAVEDAGFVIENCVYHHFGSGFPKGKSQLKPSTETWWLARKSGGKVQPLQIDACRVGVSGDDPNRRDNPSIDRRGLGYHGADRDARPPTLQLGRWPPNLVLSHADGCVRVGERRVQSQSGAQTRRSDSMGYGGNVAPFVTSDCRDPDGLETIADWRCVEGCPVKLMGEQSGVLHSQDPATRNKGNGADSMFGNATTGAHYADTGTAARFFPQFEPDPPPFVYFPKASRRDRSSNGAAVNTHPTCKSQQLMRWLIRLITPPGGTVLDCFAGSGSTLVAAVAEGMNAIGIEREAEYVEIARARIVHAERERAPVQQPLALDGAA